MSGSLSSAMRYAFLFFLCAVAVICDGSFSPGLATKHSEGFNQNGELVFSFDGKVMIQRKGG